jgi:hypothetical protein
MQVGNRQPTSGCPMMSINPAIQVPIIQEGSTANDGKRAGGAVKNMLYHQSLKRIQ